LTPVDHVVVVARPIEESRMSTVPAQRRSQSWFGAGGRLVLHVSRESAVGGPLALVRTGDVIALDVPARRLTLEVTDDELALRRAAWSPLDDRPASGYSWLYRQHVLQAPDGVDFGFLRGRRGSAVGRESH
jgi:hypothetical protein